MNAINTTTSSGTIPVTVGLAGESAVENRFAATEAQLEIWLSSQQSDEANCAYNEMSTLEFRGELDVDRLRLAVDQVISRNAMLRANFSADGHHVIVHPSADYPFEFNDLSSRSPSEQDEILSSTIREQGQKPFDLVKGSLVRFSLHQLADQHHKLLFVAHHLVLDGWSLALFCRNLGHFYDAGVGHKHSALPEADDYVDYAAQMSEYLASETGQADEDFWVKQFSDQIPVLDLPVEFSRPPLRTYSGGRYDHVLPAELVERARKMGAKSGCSLFNVMLAAFSAYVSRISGQDDFCIGIPTAGQAAMDQGELMGHCVNTMPYRTQVDGNHAFSEYLKSTRTVLLDAFEHQRYSYGTLLRKLAPPRDPSRPPMLSVSFNVDPVIDLNEMGFQGLDVDIQIEPRCFENFEWFINGVIQQDKSIEMQVQYNSDLYSEASMQFYLEGFEAFLEGIAADPDVSINSQHTMSLAQRQKVIVDWNDTKLEYPIDGTLHSEFARQAEATPDQVAVKFADRSLTYAELEARSNQVARFLQSSGIKAGDLVGICVNRSEQMLVNLFAILKAGAGYVPLDPAYPADRLQYMCDHSQLKLIVTNRDLSDRVAEFKKPQLVIDGAADQIDHLETKPLAAAAGPNDICYVIYTSGSTGKPKGVQVPHGAVVNFLHSMAQQPGFTAQDSVLAVTTLSFDIAVLELYLPTLFGGCVVILDSLTAADGMQLGEQLQRHDISLMQATPATWRLMIQAGWQGKRDLKILCGGEPMPKDLVQPLLDRCRELWNMYGPTETTVWSAAFQIESADAPILIGKPIGNTQIYVLDAQQNEVPVGCEGEVYIGGAGVTLGYRNRQDLTDERFVENRYRNPFETYCSDRLYKTGDLARYCFDGNLQFLRRNDKQVKVRGFRIELGEIESMLDAHPKVQQNVVIVREDTSGDARLVAYFVAKPDQHIESVELRDHLRESLPYYMIPQHFVAMDGFPQTNNGKIDYKALPEPTLDTSNTAETVAPESRAQKYLASVWEDVLEIDEIDLHDTFFDIGGHSLLVMKVITTVQAKTGVKLGPQDFLMGTLEQLADQIAESFSFDEEDDDSENADVERRSQVATTETDSPVQDSKASQPSDTSVEEQQPTAGKNGMFRRLKGFWD